MRLRVGTVVAAVAAACAVLAANVAAADQLKLTQAPSTFPRRVYVLSLPSGQRLQTSAVKVTENGNDVVGLAVAPAGSAKVGTGTLLAIDASNSMHGEPITSAIEAARAFAARRNANQRLAVLTFNSGTQVAQPFTLSQDAIDKALAQEPKLRKNTHIYDAIAQGIAQIQGAPQIGAASIVLLSDGADTGSALTLDQVVQIAQNAHVRVFTVGLASKTFRPGPLEQLAAETGGSYLRADSLSDLRRIYDQLGLKLAHEYIITYKSKVAPGNPVKVSVSLDNTSRSAEDRYVAALPTAVAHSIRPAWSGFWQSPLTMIALALLIPLIVAAAIVMPMRQHGSTVRTRVSDYVSMPGQKRELDALVSRVFTGTEHSLEQMRWWQRFKEDLQFADIPFAPVHVVFGTVVVMMFVGWLLALIAAPLAVCALAVPLIIRSIIKGRISRKRRIFGDQLADNLDVLASGLRAGHSLIGALSVVVADAPEPSKTEFRNVIADDQLGVDLDVALDRVVQRMKNRDLEQVALVAALQNETGGNAAEVLDRVTESIRERQELRRLISTLTAQGRLARWIVSLLPILLLVAIVIISPGYMSPMLHHTSGLIALFIGGCMIAAGSVVIGKIVDIEV